MRAFGAVDSAEMAVVVRGGGRPYNIRFQTRQLYQDGELVEINFFCSSASRRSFPFFCAGGFCLPWSSRRQTSSLFPVYLCLSFLFLSFSPSCFMELYIVYARA